MGRDIRSLAQAPELSERWAVLQHNCSIFTRENMMSPMRSYLILLCLCFGLSAELLADVTEVDNKRLAQLIEAGVPVVDVRRLDEWQATGVIDGAHKLTFFDEQGRYDAPAWLAALDKIAAKDSPVVLICARGVRSKTIAKLLDKRLGYSAIHNHTAGMVGWIKDGMPVVAHKTNE